MARQARWRQWFQPVVRSRAEYRAFVLKITLAAVVVALVFDAANQALFAADWTEAWRSLIGTLIISATIAAVAAGIVGRAYLDLYKAKSAVDVLSRTDPLTGLPNRRAFFEAAAAEPVEAMALVIIDIDRFKRVNDTRGHLVGDEVLRTVGRLFATELGSVGYVGRVGGEEFAVLGDGRNAGDLVAVLNAFRTRIAATPVVCAGQAVAVTVSGGVAVGRTGVTFDALYAEADAALYRAKSGGRNRICLAASAEALVDVTEETTILLWQSDLFADSPTDEPADAAGSAQVPRRA